MAHLPGEGSKGAQGVARAHKASADASCPGRRRDDPSAAAQPTARPPASSRIPAVARVPRTMTGHVTKAYSPTSAAPSRPRISRAGTAPSVGTSWRAWRTAPPLADLPVRSSCILTRLPAAAAAGQGKHLPAEFRACGAGRQGRANGRDGEETHGVTTAPFTRHDGGRPAGSSARGNPAVPGHPAANTYSGSSRHGRIQGRLAFRRTPLALVVHAKAPEGVAAVGLGPSARMDVLVAPLSRRERAELRGGRRSRRRDGACGPAAADRRAGPALLPALRGRTRLFVAPDGALAPLPWEALPWAEGTRVIDHFRVTRLTAGRDLPRLVVPRFWLPVLRWCWRHRTTTSCRGTRRRRKARDRATRSGARRSRDLRRTGPRFAPLPAAADEGRAVAELLDRAPLLGSFALEGRVRDIRSPGVLHVDTHGFFLPNHRPRRARRRPLQTPPRG